MIATEVKIIHDNTVVCRTCGTVFPVSLEAEVASPSLETGDYVEKTCHPAGHLHTTFCPGCNRPIYKIGI